MKILITKVSDDYWYEIKELNSLDDLINLKEKSGHSLIFDENGYIDNTMFDYWEGMKEEDKKIIPTLKFHITIYDSWIE